MIRPLARLALFAALTASLGCPSDDGGVGNVLVVASVEVTPGIGSVVIHNTTTLTASPKTASGLPVPGRTVTWSSLSPGIASVSSTGVVTGVTVGGPVTIRARVDGVNGDALITVNAVAVNSVTVTPPATPLVAGTSVQLTATAFDVGGATLSGRSFLWQSSDPNIAAVTTTGMVLAVSAGGPVTITATSEGKSGSATITVTPRVADRLGFAQQPPTSTAGAPFNPTIKIAIQDNLLGTATGATNPVTILLAANPGGATLSGTTTVNAVNGIATFGNLTLDRVGTGYTLRAMSAGLTDITSLPFNITAGAAGRLALATPPPAAAQSGVALVPQPVVQLTDANGNSVGQAGLVVTATLVSGTGTLGGTATATTNGSGAATFTGLSISGLAGSYTLGFGAPGVASVNSGAITLSAGPAAALSITTQPSVAGQSGVPLAQQPSVQIKDLAGNPVAQGGVVVTATLASGTGTLGGFTTATTSGAGLATFTSLAVNGPAGLYTLQFDGQGLAPVVSGTIALGAGAPTNVAVTLQPSPTAQVGVPFAQQPTAQLRDASNNPVATPGVNVTAAASAGGTLVGTITVTTDVTGAAHFTDLSLRGPIGNYTLTFSAGGLTPGVSNSIALSAGPAAQLGLSTQPSAAAQSGVVFPQQPVAQVQDAGGNPVGLNGVIVTAVLLSGPAGGSLSGTLTATTNGSGAAAFTNLKITGPSGAYTIRFSAAALAPVTSNPVTLGSGTATTIAAASVTSQSATAGTAVAAPPSVKVTDASTNPVAGVPVTFAVTAGGGTVLPAAPVLTNAAGIATATSWTLGAVAGTNNNTVTATSAGLGGSPVTFTASALVGPASIISANSVTNQSATVSTAVAVPPSVKVTDATGNPVASVAVTFTVTAGGGTTAPVSPAVVSTNALGIATLTTWTLGSTAGTNNNTVTATAAVPTGSPVTFTASGTAAAAGSIVANSPTTLTATVNTAVPTPPSVKVLDGSSNPVPGVPVTFTITSGGGTTVPAQVAVINTDGGGIATLTSWTLGTTAGTQTLNATQGALGPVTFTATATAAAANQIVANSVTTQSAQVSTAVSAPPQVKVIDLFGNGVAGIAVSFAVTGGGGTITPAAPSTVTTDVSGVAASTSWMLGPTVGANSVNATASVPTGSPVVFSATGTAGGATTIAANSATSLSGVAGQAVSPAPSVKVTDGIGNPVQGVVVTFAVTGGGGSISGPAGVATDINGIATVGGWTLGTTAGTNNNTLTATSGSLTGSPVNFIASGTVGVAALMTAQSSTSQNATVGTAVAAPPSVKVTDINGNVVSGFAVTFTLTSPAPAGSIVPASPAIVNTDPLGFATLTSWTLSTTAGLNSVAATGTGVSTVTFNATGIAGTPTTATANSTQSQNATAGTAVAAPPSVKVTDAFLNPVAGFGVTFTVTAGGGTTSPVSGSTVSTDAAGMATLTSWTLGNTAGTNNNTVTATPGALGAIVFTASADAGSASNIVAVSTNPQSATVGTAVAAPPSVKVTDNVGNPIAGVSVTFTLTAAPGAVISPASPATIITDGAGLATLTSWTLSTTAGANTVTATSGTLIGSPVTFSATGTAGSATTIAANSVTTQSATVATNVAAPPSVLVTDTHGNPKAGVAVTFDVAAGATGGTVTPAGPLTVTTDASGIATATSWKLGNDAGIDNNSVTATVVGLIGSPVTFTASGVAGAATQIIITTQPDVPLLTIAPADFSPQPVVRLLDAFNNPVAGVSVTAAIDVPSSSGSGTLSGTVTQITDLTGHATYTNLGITQSGNYALKFTAGLLSVVSNLVLFL